MRVYEPIWALVGPNELLEALSSICISIRIPVSSSWPLFRPKLAFLNLVEYFWLPRYSFKPYLSLYESFWVSVSLWDSCTTLRSFADHLYTHLSPTPSELQLGSFLALTELLCIISSPCEVWADPINPLWVLLSSSELFEALLSFVHVFESPMAS